MKDSSCLVLRLSLASFALAPVSCHCHPEDVDRREYEAYLSTAGAYFVEKERWRQLKSWCDSVDLVVAGRISDLHIPDRAAPCVGYCYMSLDDLTILKGHWSRDTLDITNLWQSTGVDGRPDWPLLKGQRIIVFAQLSENFFPPAQEVRQQGYVRDESWLLDYTLQRRELEAVLRGK